LKGIRMRQTRFYLLLLIVSIIIGPDLASATTTIRMDMDAGTPGLQTDIWVTPGQSFTSNIEVVMDSGSDSLAAFGYSLWWDTGELNAPTAGDITTYAFDTVWADFGYSNISSPYIYNFAQGNIADPPNGYSDGPYTGIVASIVWTAWNPVTDGLSDNTLGFYSGLDTAYDKDSNIITPVFQGGSVNIVPEPVSAVLFVIGGTALGFRRLQKKRRNVK
jgi:hypothetical protein